MENHIAYTLLQNNPGKLICSPAFQASIRKVVNKWVQRGFIKYGHTDDLTQEVNALLLEKRCYQIQKNYKLEYGSLVLYFERVVYNLCVDLIVKPTKIDKYCYSLDDVNPRFVAMHSQYENDLLEIEKSRLVLLLNKFNENKDKFLLLLKLYSRLPLTTNDIKDISQKVNRKATKELLKNFGKSYTDIEDREIFEKITPIFNLAEQKKVSPDATRRWFSSKVNLLIEKMNRKTQGIEYDREALKNLTQIVFNRVSLSA
ncbi:hypothetical protein [Microscilla marina]|uniref:Uncharacterized protein n=1 Tax=Microscilla marina ATCC 23134 TaxID=313606 RepID=A1ZFP6_MICM2|nr:hypothetical protein [Microscilla marina]EAY30820.1 hypothetical protein M23134_01144 [Microscilla marina ATCC 23134]